MVTETFDPSLTFSVYNFHLVVMNKTEVQYDRTQWHLILADVNSTAVLFSFTLLLVKSTQWKEALLF